MDISPEVLAHRITATRIAYRHCALCARRCGVDRSHGPAGFCNLGTGARVYKELVHFGEEDPLTPSHTIYMTGCSFRCVFCSDDPFVRDPSLGRAVTPAQVAERIRLRRSQGALNVNFVGGTPDVNALFILETLAHCPSDTHVVWNSNLYVTPELIDLLAGVVDTWLVDYKFGNDRCGRLAGVSDYGSVLGRSLQSVASAGGTLLLRHLLMPGHMSCCTLPALHDIATRFPHAALNVMTGYVPFAAARRLSPLDRRLSTDERREGIHTAMSAGIARLLVDGRLVDWQGNWPRGWNQMALDAWKTHANAPRS